MPSEDHGLCGLLQDSETEQPMRHEVLPKMPFEQVISQCNALVILVIYIIIYDKIFKESFSIFFLMRLANLY